jgi:hypothetical protein
MYNIISTSEQESEFATAHLDISLPGKPQQHLVFFTAKLGSPKDWVDVNHHAMVSSKPQRRFKLLPLQIAIWSWDNGKDQLGFHTSPFGLCHF